MSYLEKKTRRSLVVFGVEVSDVRIELVSGLYWDAYFADISQILSLTEGLLQDAMLDSSSITMSLTGGLYDDA